MITASRPLGPRILGALALRRATYREVSEDAGAGIQGAIVVVIGGALQASAWSASHGVWELDPVSLLDGVLWEMVLWGVWTVVVWFVAAKGFRVEADFGAFGRCVAFAFSTSLLYGLGVIPGVAEWHGILTLAVRIWFLAAMFPVVAGALDVPPRRAASIFAVTLAAMVFVREVLPYGLRLVPG